jgi:DNA polymerase III alpha subunit
VSELVPLPLKSHHSLGRGTAAPDALVQHASQLGYRSLVLADVENMFAQVQFHAACQALKLEPVTGVELRGHPGNVPAPADARARVVLLAKNARGYSALCRIVTARRASTLDVLSSIRSVEELAADAFLLTDDVALLSELTRVMDPRSLRALVIRPSPGAHESLLRTAASRLGVRVVAGVEATRLEPSDRALATLSRKIHLDSAGLWARDAASWGSELPAPAGLARAFADMPEALREARSLADECRLDLLGLARPAPDPAAAVRDLSATCAAHMPRLPAASSRSAEYSERLNAELTVIAQLGLCEPFAALSALVADARQRAVPIAARGSAVSSLVGHLLGFTPIDPVAHGLIFERFASGARRTPPDIDLDVASRHRDALIERFIAARGPERTARVASLQRFRRRSAYRLGLAALGAPSELLERFLAQLPADELLDAGHEIPERLLPEPWRGQLGTIARLVGMPRHVAVHPGGVVLAREPLATTVALERTRGGALVTQYDAASLSQLGLMKVDLLGSHCLDEIEATLSALDAGRSNTGGRAEEIPLDDTATMQRIGRAATIGCFQLESPLMRSVLARLPIRRLDDVAHALAIVRPGPGAGHAKDLFIERARHAACTSPSGAPAAAAAQPRAGLAEASARRLAEIGDLPIYEEDISFVLASVTGIALERAEALRVTLQARADDAVWLERARRRFIASGRARGVAPQLAERLWSSVVRFARYTFNKAHATSQALLAYQSAFLATHAPLEHGCAVLDHHGGLYPRRVIAAELVRRGICIRPPSVLRSRLECTVEADALEPTRRCIRVGFGLIHSLRRATCQHLVRELERAAFEGVDDLVRRVRPRAMELAALLRTGACDDLLGLTRADYPWVHDAVLERLTRGGAASLEAVIERARSALPTAPDAELERERSLRRIQNELRYLRMHISDHPMRVLREDAERAGCIRSDRLHRHAGGRVVFAGVVAATRRVPVTDATATQFITLEDELGVVEARISPRVFARLGRRLTTPGPYLLEARVVDRLGAIYLDVEALMPFHERARPGA